jgi:ankyrin repeat protein
MAYAMHFGFVEMAELLARRGAALDLRFASGVGRLDLVKSWFNGEGSLKAGAGALADPYGQERKQRGESPFRCERTRRNILSQSFYFACFHSRFESADFLLSQGADINAIVPGLDFGATVLHRIAYAGRVAVIRFLLDRGADPEILDEEHQSTAIGWARYAKRDDVVELLQR